MRLPRQFFIVAGSAAIIASIAGAAMTFNAPGAFAGNGCPPTATPDPQSFQGGVSNDLVAFGENGCTATPEGPPKTHTPTPQSTQVATEEPEVTSTAPPPPTTAPATSTPSGSAGGGGVAPPNTGSGGGESAANQWLIAGGSLMLLAGGAGAVAYGLRRQ